MEGILRDAVQAGESSRVNEHEENEEDVAMFDQAQLPDRSVYPRRLPSRPLKSVQFKDWRLCIEYRHGASLQIDDSLSVSIQEPYIQSSSTMMPDLIAEEYRGYHLKDFHPGLISFDRVAEIIHQDMGFQLDLTKHELGYILPSPGPALQSIYSTILSRDSELSLRSILSSMFNFQRLKEGEAVLTLYLWDPIPTIPILFSHGSGIADVIRAKPKNSAPSLRTAPEQAESPAALSLPATSVQLDPPTPHSLPSSTLPDLPQKSPPLIQSENAPENDKGVIFDINRLCKMVPITKPKPEDYPEDDAGFEQAIAEWERYNYEREMQFDMANTTKCQHMEPPHWKDTCRFFRHALEESQPEYIVAIHGFTRKLLPVQAHSVWWALKTIHSDIGGIMICHSMGIGKTTIAFGIHHVQHTINRMWEQIWAEPDKHLFSSDDLSEPDMSKVCPSQDPMMNRYGFDCPCYLTSPTHFVKQKLGISVALVPLGLIDTWRYEWQQCFANNKNQKLLIAHGSYETRNEPAAWNLIQGKEKKRRELAIEAISCDPEEGFEEHDGPSTFTPLIRNGNCFVISTSQSISTKFLNHPLNCRKKNWELQEKPYPRSRRDPSKGLITPKQKTIPGKKYQSCVVSMIFKDEFQHQDTQAANAIQEIVGRQKQSPPSNIALIPMSGTPLTSGPLDIARYVELMIKPSWNNHPILRKFMKTEVKDMGERWKKALLKFGSNNPKDRQELSNIRAEVQNKLPALVETLFVRSTTESKIGNYPVVKVPTCLFRTIFCEHTEANQLKADQIAMTQQKAFEKKEETRRLKYLSVHHGDLQSYTPLSKTNVNTFYRSRVCATFPALVNLQDTDGNFLKLTNDEWIEKVTSKAWRPGTNSDPYFSNLDAIVKSSGKIIEIRKMLDDFNKRLDGEHKRCRHIFISYFFVVVYIFELWLLNYRNVPRQDVISVNNWKTPSPAKRTAALSKFHVDLGSKVPVGEQDTAKFVIATSSAISLGLTLAEAISVSFLEPDYDPGKLAQGFARHCRQGNKNKEVYCYIFMVKKSKIERKILEISNLRKQIDSVQSRKHEVLNVGD